MNTRIFHLEKPPYEAEEIRSAADIIKQSGLLAFPTETVYGLGANGLDGKAVRRIFEAKGRPMDNPLILHVATAGQIEDYCEEIPVEAWVLADHFWPGPLTMILKRRSIVPDETTAGLDTVGVRCPDHPVALAILKEAGVPVAAPSANRSGRPSPTRFFHVLADLDGRVEGIVDGGDCAVGVESTIVDLTTSPPRLLRPGGVSLESLRAILGPLDVDAAVLNQISDLKHPRAPGMKYRHYAPRAPVTVVSGPANETAFYIKQRAGAKDGVLCFAEYLPLFGTQTVEAIGSIFDPKSQAKEIFHALRKFDETQVERIFAQCPKEEGVGFAVANRLKKAAGFHVIEVEPRNDEMKIIGITGGTGAGKTSALMVLKKWGACIIDCDAVYHTLLERDHGLRQALTERFGAILNESGGVDRKKLGQVVFDDPQALQDLNRMTHGFVERAVLRELNEAREKGVPIAAIDAIALLESGLGDRCHKVVGVVAPESLRIARIMRREGISEEYARLRIQAQKPDSFFRTQCDAILENQSDDLNKFEQTAMELFYSILK